MNMNMNMNMNIPSHSNQIIAPTMHRVMQSDEPAPRSQFVKTQDLNNLGVEMMQNQRFDEANQVLSEALKSTKLQLKRNQERLLAIAANTGTSCHCGSCDCQDSAADNAEASSSVAAVGPQVGSQPMDQCHYQQHPQSSVAPSQGVQEQSAMPPTSALASASPQCCACSGDFDARCEHMEYTFLRNTSGLDYTDGLPLVGFILYNPAVCLPEPSLQTEGCTRCYAKLSFVIVMNLAQSHHMRAIQLYTQSHKGQSTEVDQTCPAGTLKLFMKALRLYEVAQAIYNKQTADEESSGPDSSMLEMMLIVNNTAQIHQILRNSNQVQACQQRLLEVIMFFGHHSVCDPANGLIDNVANTSEQNTPAATSRTVSRMQLQGVMKNVQRVHLQDQLVTAAAA